MNKKIIARIIAGSLVVIAIIGYSLLKSTKNNAVDNSSGNTVVKLKSQVPVPATKNNEITMVNNGFVPQNITIQSGDTVHFINKDTVPHWPASDPHPSHTGYKGFDSLHPVAPGKDYSFQFIRLGKFGFHDHLNPGFTGQISVEASNTSTQPISASNTPVSVGSITWHQKNFIGKQVYLVGYILKKEKNYVIFSDEPTGAITKHDLPVSGIGATDLILKHKYIFKGVFLDKGLAASNKSTYHLELSEPAQPVLLK